jgi:hypothetical protein
MHFKTIYFFAALLFATSVHAQQSLTLLDNSNHLTSIWGRENSNPIYRNDIRSVALRHFINTYGEGLNAEWNLTSFGFRAEFKKEEIKYLVDYNRAGFWLSTIRFYGENEMPRDIRRIVKSVYFDYEIELVSEVNYGKQVVYHINIQDETSLKKLIVMDGEMTVEAEYTRADR